MRIHKHTYDNFSFLNQNPGHSFTSRTWMCVTPTLHIRPGRGTGKIRKDVARSL